MKKAILKSICLAAGVAVASTAVAGKPAGACKRVKWVEGQYFEVHASVHSYTHIILPEPVMGEPMYGSPELWDVKAENVHLFVKPYNYGNKEGAVTSVTVISDTNNSYDFVVKRAKPGKATPCVMMTADMQRHTGMNNGWLRPEDRKVHALKQQVQLYEKQLAQADVNSEAKALDALDKYRANVFTGYTWKGKSGGFVDSDIIDDVFDDGRFTVIRLKNDNKGMLQLKASINGSEEFVEYDYNADQKLYTVAGLYPKLILTYDETEIVITRKEG